MLNKTDNDSSIQSALSPYDDTVLFLYAVLMIAGVTSNACLICIVLSQKSAKNRSPLLISLFTSDLLVCGVSIPLTVHHIRYGDSSWILPGMFCKLAVYVQTVPVGASTLSLMALSLDRYVSVRCPQPVGQHSTTRRKYVVIFSTVSCWLASCLVNIPWLLARTSVNGDDGRQCIQLWKSHAWKISYIFVYLLLIYTIPCIIIMICHLGLREKLTALSLSSRAAKGEMPLPLPLLHLSSDLPFIIIGLATKPEGKVLPPYHRPSMSVGDEDRQEVKLLDVVETSFTSPPRRKKLKLKIFIKTRKKSSNYRRRAKAKTNHIRNASETVKRPKMSTMNNAIKSRRRMATALVITGMLTSVCWIPYIICVLCMTLCATEYDPIMIVLERFSLFLGHAHSFVNPIVYWTMNHESITRCSCPCSCFMHFKSAKKNPFHRTNSSTNEMALGPFNPKYTKPPVPKKTLRRTSSCYLY